jgi:CubicO group peptidase (beta-lactamase class C family)
MTSGYVHRDFLAVGDWIQRLTDVPGGGGAAVCIYHRGECVVDAWAGQKNESGAPWQRDTLAMSYSTTKGVLATMMMALVDQGVVDYDDRVAQHWPAFADAGKEKITIRHLLSHEAGLHPMRSLVDHADRMLDWNFMTTRLAEARPAWAPGSRPGYHGLTFGWLVGEVVRRATNHTVNEALQTLIARPLGLDGAFIGAPPEVRSRVADLLTSEEKPKSRWRTISPRILDGAWRMIGIDRKDLRDALLPHGAREIYRSQRLLDAELPALNGFFTARALARMYAMLAEGGELDGTRFVSSSTLARATQIQSRKLDAVVGFPMRWRLGYHFVGTNRGILPDAFGHFGYGGSGAWADPTRRLAVALTVNRVAGTPFGDMRMARLGGLAVRSAAQRTLARQRPPTRSGERSPAL